MHERLEVIAAAGKPCLKNQLRLPQVANEGSAGDLTVFCVAHPCFSSSSESFPHMAYISMTDEQSETSTPTNVHGYTSA